MIANIGWTWRRIFRPELGSVILLISTGLVSTVLPALQPALSRWIVDDLVRRAGAGLVLPGLLMCLTFLLPGPIGRIGDLPRADLEERTIRRLDELIIDVGEALPDSGSVERPDLHDQIKAAQNQVGMSSRLPYLCLGIVGQGLGIVTLLISLGALAWWLPLILLAAGIPHMVGEHRMMTTRFQSMQRQARIARELDYCMTAATDPQLAKEIRAFGLGEFFLDRFDRLAERGLGEMLDIRLRSARTSGLAALGYAIAVAACFAYIARQTVLGHLTAGDIALYLTAVTSLFMNLFRFGASSAMGADTLKRAGFLRELENRARPGIVVAEPGRAAPSRFDSGIRLSSVGFGYPTRADDDQEPVAVLRDLTLDVPAGKVLALVGENGEGKSTLVKLLTRMYDPTSGEIAIDQIPIADFNLASLRSRIATVYQDHARFALTLGENIAIGVPELLMTDHPDRDQLIAEAAAKGGATGVVEKLGGYDAELTRRFGGVDLSGGEWQRVATARAFLPDAALIILDEPTSALDVDAERKLFDSFAELVRGRTAIMISHRFSTVRTADVIAVLADGGIAEYGSHSELMARNGRYAELFNLQANRYRD